MLKHVTIKNFGLFIFVVGIILHFYIDYSQGGYPKGDDFRKFYVFTGRNIVQILIGTSVACLTSGWFSVLPMGWAFYNVENIYYRIVTGGVYELENWMLSVGIIFLVCIVKLISQKK